MRKFYFIVDVFLSNVEIIHLGLGISHFEQELAVIAANFGVKRETASKIIRWNKY
jgi:hypothetical protein